MKRTSTLLIAASIGIVSIAQPNLNSANNTPAVLDSFAYHLATWMAPGPAGGSQAFDFTALDDPGMLVEMSYVLPSTTTNAAAFSTTGATVASNDGLGHVYYYKVTASAMERVGDDTNNVQVPFTDGVIELPFPCTAGTHWTDAQFATYTSNMINVTRTGSITGDGDAWGDLTLPTSILNNVLRVHTVDTVHDALGGFGTITNVIDRYSFYKTWLPVPALVLQSKSFTINGVTTVTKYALWLDETTASVLERSTDPFGLRVFPNPATDQVTVDFGTGAPSRMTMEVFDAMGRMVKSEQLGSLAPGFQRRTFDAHGLGAGLYTVRLCDANGNASSVRLVVD